MRIVIMGSGAVGGYFGGRLAAVGGDVTFVARGDHLAAIQKHGLRIESPLGDLHLPRVRATGDPSSLVPADIVFLTVKLYDTAAAISQMAPLIGPQTLVVSFQNGVDAVGMLTGAFGRAHVVGGTTDISAVIAEPGVIRHVALNRLVFGPVPENGAFGNGRHASPLLEGLLSATRAAGVDGVLSDRIVVDIWAKFARLTAFSAITAVARSAIGPVVDDPELFELMTNALHESIAVARGRQIPLPGRFYDEALAIQLALPPETRSSMLEDLERGKPLELPWLSGAVVRIGEEVGVPTPTHRLLVALLHPHVAGRVAA